MIRLKLMLKPKKHVPISVNYKYYLAAYCNKLISSCVEDIDSILNKYTAADSSKKNEVLSFTQFFCTDYEIKDKKIIFKDAVNWYITSPVYELILHIVQELFNSNIIKIANEEFEIISYEAAEIEDTTAVEINKESIKFPLDRVNELLEKLDNYYILSKDEMLI